MAASSLLRGERVPDSTLSYPARMHLAQMGPLV
jgi:hypothetical protein